MSWRGVRIAPEFWVRTFFGEFVMTTKETGLEIVQIPLLKDNYSYLVHDTESGLTAVVDPAEPEPVLNALSKRGWTLTHLLNTHHHGDHVSGNHLLKRATHCRIYGPSHPGEPIPDLDVAIGEGDRIEWGRHAIEVLAVPGHTQGHVAFWLDETHILFCGDTLFAMGCGRLLGGTAEQLWMSLDRLRRLPDDSLIYCAHEYTEANGRFALTIEPGNSALQVRMQAVAATREQGLSTLPTRLDQERATNPFLRWESPEIRQTLGMEDASPLEVFTALRRRKDAFQIP